MAKYPQNSVNFMLKHPRNVGNGAFCVGFVYDFAIFLVLPEILCHKGFYLCTV